MGQDVSDVELAKKFIEVLGEVGRDKTNAPNENLDLWSAYCELSELELWDNDPHYGNQLARLGKIIRELKT